MIQEDYISFETAKLLKEKGFPQELGEIGCINKIPYYTQNGGFVTCDLNTIRQRFYPEAIAPTLQMAMKWLREVHKVYIDIHTYFDEEPVEYNAICYKDGIYNDTLYYTTEYEDAVNNAIKYALENLI